MMRPQILIVEDDRIVAECLQRNLVDLGYAVSLIMSSAEEAIEEVRKNKPDLILMDIKLRGDIDGVEAAKRILARFDIPIIFITAFADNNTLQRAKEVEPYGYIYKPIEEKELHTTIEMALYKHRMENKLRESEKKYRALFEDSKDAIYITSRNGIISDVNKAFLDIFGVPREEVIGRNAKEGYVHPVDRRKLQMEIEEKGSVKDFEVKLRTKNGTEKDCLISATARLAYDGSILGDQGIVRDITERKKKEQEKDEQHAQFVQSETMAGIGTLASGIAHELNNLLQIIRGYTELAQGTKKAKDMAETLKIVLAASDKAAKIIRDLLSFSNQEKSEMESYDIAEIVESVLSLTMKQLMEHNIEVVRDFGETFEIEMNRGEMQQVFLNMIMNARDAMFPKGGKLVINITRVKKNGEVSICDTGKGIEKENLSKVFEPFYTTKGTVGRDSKLQGTGLGLSVSYGIVKRHGGMIKVESEVGKGTTFTIKFPLRGKG